MTRDSDFKAVVRARAARTGETYTAARAALRAREQEYAAARAEQQRLVRRLFTDGRIERIPAKRKVRAAVLLEVVGRFAPGQEYDEREVNEILRTVHDDVAYLRRELVNYRYLEREAGRYRTAAQPPVRTGVELQEVPAWEAHWLPGFLGLRSEA